MNSQNNPFSLQGKTILVTGASSGIGKAIAVECSKSGARLILTGRNKRELTNTLQALSGNHHQLIQTDLSQEDQINVLVENLPVLDGLVNTAGIVKTLPFLFIKPEQISAIMDINFLAPVFLAQKLIKTKKLGAGGSVVIISSIEGPEITHVGNSMYAASKGAITAMAKSMALELAPKKIRVNSILPGMIDTSMIHTDAISNEQLEAEIRRYPLKRYGKPEEIAYAVIYLLSEASAWTTGTNLIIDGGFTLT